MFWTGLVSSGDGLRRAMRKWGVTVAVASGLAAGAALHARTPEAPAALPAAAMAELPQEARQTHQRILSGGPFAYQKDGAVFGNREQRLPAKPRGHYREYTVKTISCRAASSRHSLPSSVKWVERAERVDDCSPIFVTTDNAHSVNCACQLPGHLL